MGMSNHNSILLFVSVSKQGQASTLWRSFLYGTWFSLARSLLSSPVSFPVRLLFDEFSFYWWLLQLYAYGGLYANFPYFQATSGTHLGYHVTSSITWPPVKVFDQNCFLHSQIHLNNSLIITIHFHMAYIKNRNYFENWWWIFHSCL